MSALSPGVVAPTFTLPTMDGKQFSLEDALSRGPVLLAFFKISCPVCQYAFPYLERIYKSYGNGKITIVGISQNDKKDTASFLREFGVTFPVLLDDPKLYPVSNAYGLTNVPSLFWISPSQTIEVSSVGWLRKDIDELNQRAASTDGQNLVPVFRPNENVPEFRAG